MPRSEEQLSQRIDEVTRGGFRGRLLSRGLARNLIWSKGQIPADSPQFAESLTGDLLSYGLALLSLGLELRTLRREHPHSILAFERAAEAIESVVNDGNPAWNERGFYTVIASVAYHLGHFSARAFSIFPSETERLNLSPAERVLTYLIRRDLSELRRELLSLSSVGGGFDLSLATALRNEGEKLDFDSAIALSLNSLFYKALALFDFSLEAGARNSLLASLKLLDEGMAIARDYKSVPFWWLFTLTRHLVDDLWSESLHVRLPVPPSDPTDSSWSAIRWTFIAQLHQRGRAEIELWPSQLEAAQRAMNVADDLIAALPTSAGKTRIAEICILRTLALKGRVVFITPLRALSAQTERTLRRTFTPLGYTVSSLYGSSGSTGDDNDSLLNRDIVVATPEKLDFALRNNAGILDTVTLIVLDEAHTIGAAEREVRYEILVQRLLRRSDAGGRRLVCLSAILPQGEQLKDFVEWIRQDQKGEAISLNWRPTRQRFGEIVWNGAGARLDFQVEQEAPFVNGFVTQRPGIGRRRNPFPNNQQELTFASAWRLVEDGQTVLIYCPLRKSVNSLAKTAMELAQKGYLKSLLDPDDAHALQNALNIGREWLGNFHPAVECLNIGVAVHHAQLPRPFLRAVEQLLTRQILKVTIASPTLAQGLNLSATTVILYSLMRGRDRIPGEEFSNVSGRAGRAFVDLEGRVLCVAFERKHLRHWQRLLTASKERDLRSGLFQLVLWFCQQIASRKQLNAAQIVEHVLGNSSAWEPPKSTRNLSGEEQAEQVSMEQHWMRDLASLDSALLSLVQQDVPIAGLAVALDDALNSSLWKRTLARQSPDMQSMAQAVLLGRAGFLWQNSTPSQRKGYFSAGIGFATGKYLDLHADEMGRLLDTANDSLESGELDQAFHAIVHFAELAFAVEPFKPDKIPDDWEDILWNWMIGESLSDLAGAQDSELLEFVEGALVYRLVWAMESVRVRRLAVTGEDEQSNAGRAALAIETGTPNYWASMLIQNGMPSRVAAMKAVTDCRPVFRNVAQMRTWLFSPRVVEMQKNLYWPTQETAALWREFVAGFSSRALQKWSIHSLVLPVVWYSEPPSQGTPVRVYFDAGTGRTVIYSDGLDRLGELTASFGNEPVGILHMTVGGMPNQIQGSYVGPADIIHLF